MIFSRRSPRIYIYIVGLVVGTLVWYLPPALSIGMYWPMMIVSAPSFIVGFVCDNSKGGYLLSLFLSMMVVFFIKLDSLGQLVLIVAFLHLLVFIVAIVFMGLGVFSRNHLRKSQSDGV